jgi:hypothetical protein
MGDRRVQVARAPFPARGDNSCDSPGAQRCGPPFDKTERLGQRVEEYVQTSTKPRPASAGLPPAEIPVIVTHAYHGELAVSLSYSESPSCSSALMTTLVQVMGSGSAEDTGTDDAGI